MNLIEIQRGSSAGSDVTSKISPN